MAAAQQAGIADSRATFECSFAQRGSDIGFYLLAGIEPLLDALERLKLRSDELDWLASERVIDARTRKRLVDLKFSCDVDAAPEGSIVFPGSSILTVEGPYWQAQLVSSLVRGALNASTLVATKAARCLLAGSGADLIESSSATAHQLGGNPLVARAAYLGGARATTCALAAKRFELPFAGSMPWRHLLASKDAKSAYDAWLATNQPAPILRLDHRDPRPSTAAIIAALDGAAGKAKDVGVEIGGGDYVEIACLVQDMFKRAKLKLPLLYASGGLDELRILELRRQSTSSTRGINFHGFFVSSFGLQDGASISRYELVAIEESGRWAPRLRVGSTFATSGVPGRKTTLRYTDSEGSPLADVAYATNERTSSPEELRFVDRTTGLPTRIEGATKSAPLLEAMMRSGKRVRSVRGAAETRDMATKQLERVHERHRRLLHPQIFPIGLSESLASQKEEALRSARRAG